MWLNKTKKIARMRRMSRWNFRPEREALLMMLVFVVEEPRAAARACANHVYSIPNTVCLRGAGKTHDCAV